MNNELNIIDKTDNKESSTRFEPTKEFLLVEYQSLMAAYISNEETGDKRINAYLTVSGAILIALGFGSKLSDNSASLPGIASIIGLFFIVLMGTITYNRIIHRNIITDEYIRGLARIRQFFIDNDQSIEDYLIFGGKRKGGNERFRKKRWRELFSFASGGSIETISLLNSFAIWVFLATIFANRQYISSIVSGVPFSGDTSIFELLQSSVITCIVLPAAWFAHFFHTRWIYRRTKMKNRISDRQSIRFDYDVE